MKAVWSFWSKPFDHAAGSLWGSFEGFLHSWVLSFQLAQAHYPLTELHTDSAGARLLVDRLQLPFDDVHITLDALSDHDPDWWALGKLYAYREQTEPFVHIDQDVYLWKRLPDALVEADVFAQSPEQFEPGDPTSWYPILAVEDCFDRATTGTVPDEWHWYRKQSSLLEAACCGILGGTHLDFINNYAQRAIDFVESPANQSAWALFGDRARCNVLVEQYLLKACVEWHRCCGDRGKFQMDYLFPSHGAPFDEAEAKRVGFTHLIAGAKQNGEVLKLLSNRVRHDYPNQYERIARIVADGDTA